MPQLMAPTLLTTVPEPLPDLVTVSVSASGAPIRLAPPRSASTAPTHDLNAFINCLQTTVRWGPVYHHARTKKRVRLWTRSPGDLQGDLVDTGGLHDKSFRYCQLFLLVESYSRGDGEHWSEII